MVDPRWEGHDAGAVLDGRAIGTPVVATVAQAASLATVRGLPATHLVMGLAPDGGRLPDTARQDVLAAIRLGLHVDSGLHDLLGDDPEISEAARACGVWIRDLRAPIPRSQLHFFSGAIREVTALKVAVLGTDSAVGKRTTAWMITDAIRRLGHSAEMIGTGQTAWLQGARWCILLDALINDFVAGELEHAVCSAFHEARPEAIIVEGQGSLLHPAYPRGFEILAAARPDVIVLQHAPARIDYDGFPGFPVHPLHKQIAALEMVSDRPVVALTINHEGIPAEAIDATCARLADETGLPTADVLVHGADNLARLLTDRLNGARPLHAAC